MIVLRWFSRAVKSHRHKMSPSNNGHGKQRTNQEKSHNVAKLETDSPNALYLELSYFSIVDFHDHQTKLSLF